MLQHRTDGSCDHSEPSRSNKHQSKLLRLNHTLNQDKPRLVSIHATSSGASTFHIAPQPLTVWIRNCSTFNELYNLCSKYAESLNSIHICAAFSRLVHSTCSNSHPSSTFNSTTQNRNHQSNRHNGRKAAQKQQQQPDVIHSDTSSAQHDSQQSNFATYLAYHPALDLNQLRSREVSNLLWGAAKLNVQELGTWASGLMNRLQEIPIHRLNSQDISNSLWAIASLGLSPHSGWLNDVLHHWTGLPTHHQHEANILWALARLEPDISSHTLSQLQDRAFHEMPNMNGQELANTLHSLASLSAHLEPEQLVVLEASMTVVGPRMSPQAAANTCYALARLRGRPLSKQLSPQGAADTEEEDVDNVDDDDNDGTQMHHTSGETTSHTFTLRDSAARGAAKSTGHELWDDGYSAAGASRTRADGAREEDVRYWREHHHDAESGSASHSGRLSPDEEEYLWARCVHVLTKAAARQLQGMRSQELANMMWGLAKLGWVPEREWLHSFYAASSMKLPACNAQDLVQLLWSVAKVGCRPPQPWTSSIVLALQPHLHSLNPQQLSNITCALVHLNHTPPSAWALNLLVAVRRKLPSFTVQGLANLAWGASQPCLHSLQGLLPDILIAARRRATEALTADVGTTDTDSRDTDSRPPNTQTVSSSSQAQARMEGGTADADKGYRDVGSTSFNVQPVSSSSQAQTRMEGGTADADKGHRDVGSTAFNVQSVSSSSHSNHANHSMGVAVGEATADVETGTVDMVNNIAANRHVDRQHAGEVRGRTDAVTMLGFASDVTDGSTSSRQDTHSNVMLRPQGNTSSSTSDTDTIEVSMLQGGTSSSIQDADTSEASRLQVSISSSTHDGDSHEASRLQVSTSSSTQDAVASEMVPPDSSQCSSEEADSNPGWDFCGMQASGVVCGNTCWWAEVTGQHLNHNSNNPATPEERFEPSTPLPELHTSPSSSHHSTSHDNTPAFDKSTDHMLAPPASTRRRVCVLEQVLQQVQMAPHGADMHSSSTHQVNALGRPRTHGPAMRLTVGSTLNSKSAWRHERMGGRFAAAATSRSATLSPLLPPLQALIAQQQHHTCTPQQEPGMSDVRLTSEVPSFSNAAWNVRTGQCETPGNCQPAALSTSIAASSPYLEMGMFSSLQHGVSSLQHGVNAADQLALNDASVAVSRRRTSDVQQHLHQRFASTSSIPVLRMLDFEDGDLISLSASEDVLQLNGSRVLPPAARVNTWQVLQASMKGPAQQPGVLTCMAALEPSHAELDGSLDCHVGSNGNTTILSNVVSVPNGKWLGFGYHGNGAESTVPSQRRLDFSRSDHQPSLQAPVSGVQPAVKRPVYSPSAHMATLQLPDLDVRGSEHERSEERRERAIEGVVDRSMGMLNSRTGSDSADGGRLMYPQRTHAASPRLPQFAAVQHTHGMNAHLDSNSNSNSVLNSHPTALVTRPHRVKSTSTHSMSAASAAMTHVNAASWHVPVADSMHTPATSSSTLPCDSVHLATSLNTTTSTVNPTPTPTLTHSAPVLSTVPLGSSSNPRAQSHSLESTGAKSSPGSPPVCPPASLGSNPSPTEITPNRSNPNPSAVSLAALSCTSSDSPRNVTSRKSSAVASAASTHTTFESTHTNFTLNASHTPFPSSLHTTPLAPTSVKSIPNLSHTHLASSLHTPPFDPTRTHFTPNPSHTHLASSSQTTRFESTLTGSTFDLSNTHLVSPLHTSPLDSTPADSTPTPFHTDLASSLHTTPVYSALADSSTSDPSHTHLQSSWHTTPFVDQNSTCADSASHSSAVSSHMFVPVATALCTIFHSCGTLGFRPDDSWLSWFMGVMERELPAFSPRAVVSVLWACAALRQTPSMSWMRHVLHHLRERAGATAYCDFPGGAAFTAKGQVVVLWALVKMRMHPGDSWLCQRVVQCSDQLHSLAPRHVSVFLWTLCRLLPFGSAQAVARGWATGKLKGSTAVHAVCTSLQHKLWPAVTLSLPQYGPRELGLLLWSVACLGLQPSRAFLTAAALKLQTFHYHMSAVVGTQVLCAFAFYDHMAAITWEQQRHMERQSKGRRKQASRGLQAVNTYTLASGKDAQPPGTHTQSSGTRTQSSGTHTQLSGTHTQLSGTHTQLSGTHTQSSGTHTHLSGVHTHAFGTDSNTDMDVLGRLTHGDSTGEWDDASSVYGNEHSGEIGDARRQHGSEIEQFDSHLYSSNDRSSQVSNDRSAPGSNYRYQQVSNSRSEVRSATVGQDRSSTNSMDEERMGYRAYQPYPHVPSMQDWCDAQLMMLVKALATFTHMATRQGRKRVVSVRAQDKRARTSPVGPRQQAVGTVASTKQTRNEPSDSVRQQQAVGAATSTNRIRDELRHTGQQQAPVGAATFMNHIQNWHTGETDVPLSLDVGHGGMGDAEFESETGRSHSHMEEREVSSRAHVQPECDEQMSEFDGGENSHVVHCHDVTADSLSTVSLHSQGENPYGTPPPIPKPRRRPPDQSKGGHSPSGGVPFRVKLVQTVFEEVGRRLPGLNNHQVVLVATSAARLSGYMPYMVLPGSFRSSLTVALKDCWPYLSEQQTQAIQHTMQFARVQSARRRQRNARQVTRNETVARMHSRTSMRL